jgi:phage terminase large subunit GpA-like protein
VIAAAAELTPRGPCAGAFGSRLRPRPSLTVSQWADQHRVVPPGTSPEPGAWRTDRVPYLREILDAASDPTVERIAIQAASQIGKSEILLSVIGYYADQEPAPILLVQSTEEAMRGFSKERVAPMFAATPALRGKLADGARDPSNTVMLRQFPGGLLACAWAGSAASLASRPIRIVLGDELDRWPDTTGRDGDPWAQAVQRTSNFFNRKILAVSTPTVEGFSAIARLYDDSDQRRYHVPCPLCGAYQVLEWSGVIYKDEAGEVDLDQVHYRCAHCAGRIEERERPAMLAAGEWRPEREHWNRGYQISALYSPWVRWRDLAAEWIKAHVDRDKRGLQEFVNLRLGETWTEESERITVEALEKNREEYGTELPDGVLLLTAGVDVQDNRLEAEVVGWGVGKESWGISYAIFAGDTATPAPWARLDEFLARAWSKADGRQLALWCACVDSGGHRTQEVYEFCRARLARNVFAVKGYAGAGRPIVGKVTTSNQLRVPLYPVGADTGKEAVYSRLALAEPGPGYCHFPIERGRGYDDEYFKGLVSEKRVTKIRAGRRVTRWTPTRARNEPLDVRVYATAAMELLTPDFAALATAEEKARQAAPVTTSAKPQRRRVLSKGVEW